MSASKKTIGYLGKPSSEVETLFTRLIGDRWNFVMSNGPADTPEFRAALPQLDYMVVSATRVTGPLVAEAPKLKLVNKFGVGYDDIDVNALTEQGIAFAVCPAGLAEAVSEHALALILSVLKRIPQGDDEIRRKGEWPTWQIRAHIRQLGSRTAGIVGFGRIGRMVARLLLAFGCNVLVYDEMASRHGFEAEQADGRLAFADDLDDLFARSSIVTLHVPLTEETQHLVTEARMRLLGPEGLLVNTARGAIVDQEALTRCLKEGVLGFAALDVVADERAGTGAPLFGLPNVIVTPHVAGGGPDVLERRAAFIIDNIEKLEAGLPISDGINTDALRSRKGVPA
ncbi:NAD(P)-dependent oxidoreductase [Neorhizobium sp. DT-125]|uniref:NAD(P)-dependent oxidoreductase n=1 Tax=Neorhizobium sp. DT-125 TaxID=3396163 RepID=UPI003F1ABB66